MSSSVYCVWQDVTYTVINSQDKKSKISLLQNVSGYLNPGEMSALVRRAACPPGQPSIASDQDGPDISMSSQCKLAGFFMQPLL